MPLLWLRKTRGCFVSHYGGTSGPIGFRQLSNERLEGATHCPQLCGRWALRLHCDKSSIILGSCRFVIGTTGVPNSDAPRAPTRLPPCAATAPMSRHLRYGLRPKVCRPSLRPSKRWAASLRSRHEKRRHRRCDGATTRSVRSTGSCA